MILFRCEDQKNLHPGEICEAALSRQAALNYARRLHERGDLRNEYGVRVQDPKGGQWAYFEIEISELDASRSSRLHSSVIPPKPRKGRHGPSKAQQLVHRR